MSVAYDFDKLLVARPPRTGKLVCFVLPVFNEAGVLPAVLAALPKGQLWWKNYWLEQISRSRKLILLLRRSLLGWYIKW